MTPLPLTLDPVVTVASGLMSSEVDGELVMMDVERGAYYGLDPIAARIWAGIAEPVRLGDLCALLVAEYDIDKDTCEAEVLAFMTDLHSSGLIALN